MSVFFKLGREFYMSPTPIVLPSWFRSHPPIVYRPRRRVHAMADDNGHSGLLGMGKEIFSLVADCTGANGGSRYRDWPAWNEWVLVPLELMAEESDIRATAILANGVTFFESKDAVLGIAEELLELVLRKAPEEMRNPWLQAALEDALGSGNLDITTRLLDTSELSQHVWKTHVS